MTTETYEIGQIVKIEWEINDPLGMAGGVGEIIKIRGFFTNLVL